MTSDHVVITIWLLVGLIIFFVVLFFGWTGIGWGVAVIMSARSREGLK